MTVAAPPGLGRDLAEALAEDGVDRDDPAAVSAWIRSFHTRRMAGADTLAAELDDLDGPVAEMAPVLLAPRTELEAAARAVPCMAAVEEDGPISHPLRVWEAAVSAGLTRLADVAGRDGADRPWTGAVASRVIEVLVLLYARRRPVPTTDVRDGVFADVAVDHDLDLTEPDVVSAWLHGLDDELESALAHLEDLGVVDRRDDAVALSDLGTWAVNRVLLAAGVEAPVAGEWAESDAETLLAACVHLDPAHADLEIDLWCERRGPQAVGDLVAVARATVDPAVRAMAFDALDLLGDDAEPAVRRLGDDPVLAPLVEDWLSRR